ncbi:Scs3p Ecym_3068 [Eremothecium cymbalariae DBVPG|uniref:Acyl-coenzyme A diphosphatase SCS3 n=1 Tax=Eremothecium cymbalariae (strain CBS 270.75 / DBVPG 7215 / KCTC 17166 / NRRL Y-17582) TaxID=931890 RepID=G8JR11_ERECY|nr:Hypothetical protein Ecym_3068 [Eremothecium cymbalariae DBVPG\
MNRRLQRFRSASECFLFLLCPSILVVGNVISLLSISDFWVANKDGILNVWFVKRGWFWTSVIAWWCQIRYGDLSHTNIKRTLIRYILLTVWWFTFTQSVWVGVAPIMDLVFKLTGGHCSFDVFDQAMVVSEKFQDSEPRRLGSLKKLVKWFSERRDGNAGMGEETVYWLNCRLGEGPCENTSPSNSAMNSFISEALNNAYPIDNGQMCRKLGGYWTGGHDPSGHVFLITLMTMFLIGELRLFSDKVGRRLRSTSYTYFRMSFAYVKELLNNGLVWNLIDDDDSDQTPLILKTLVYPPLKCFWTLFKIIILLVTYIIWENPVIFLIGLIFTWLWAFFITCTMFHSLGEQLTGLIAAYIVVSLIYWYIY